MTKRAAIAAAAKDLAPLLAEHAAEAERQRRPVDAVIEALRDARIFDLMVPECHGGLGLDVDSFVDVGLALGEGDASMAWVASFYIEHNWMLCQFPLSFQRELYADRSHVLAPAAISPTGRADVVDGGHRLSGRWSWGTGIAHAEWVIVGAPTTSAGAPDMRLFALPREQVTVDDVWFVDGMCGTGSNDMVVDDTVVPLDRSVSMAALANGTSPTTHSSALYRTPMLPILGLAAAMPAVGQATAAVRRFRDDVGRRNVFLSAAKQADRPSIQIRLARADIDARQSELALRSVAADLMSLRDAATLADRARMLAVLANCVHQSKRALLTLAEVSGARGHFTDHPLQRAVRDVQTLSCHVIFDLDSRLELHGRSLLGLEVGGLL